MRTGSNFLETNLNAMQDVTCHGEAFNPHFVGYPNKTSLFGLDEAARDADPKKLLQEIKTAPGINGFRYFHDHDARVFVMNRITGGADVAGQVITFRYAHACRIATVGAKASVE